MNSFFHEAVEENPIIAAVKNMDDLKICCSLEDIRVDHCRWSDLGQRICDGGTFSWSDRSFIYES